MGDATTYRTLTYKPNKDDQGALGIPNFRWHEGWFKNLYVESLHHDYWVDPTKSDQGVAGDGHTIKDLVDSIGSTKNATLYLTHNPADGNTTTYTLTTPETIPDNIKVVIQNGAQIDGAGTLTFAGGPSQIIASPTQQIFGSSITIYFSKFGEVTPEWFGALGDGSTNDYAAFTAALSSGCVQGGGVKLLINTHKVYVLNNSSNPAIKFDVESLPDGTDSSGWSRDAIPTFHIIGDSPPASMPDSGVPSGYLKITGTGDGIQITSSAASSLKWRGQIHLENIALNGNSTADSGISIDYADRYNTFRNIEIKSFTGNGLELGSSNTFTMRFDNIRTHDNEGIGFVIDGNAYDFYSCSSEYNGGGGIKIQNQGNQINWFGGTIQYNAIPQVLIAAGDSINFDGTYLEGQDDALNGSEVAGSGEGIFEIDTDSSGIFNLSFRNLRIVPATPTSDTYQEQYIFNIHGSNGLYGLNIDNLRVGDFSNTGFNNYIVNDLSSFTLSQASYRRVYWSGGTADGDFENNATEELFNYSEGRDPTSQYSKTRNLIKSFAVTFHRTNLADNTNDQVMYLNGSTNIPDQEIKFPYDCSLVAISINSNISAGSLTVKDSNTGLSQTLTQATDGDSKQVRFDLDDHTINDANKFTPLIDTSSLSSATRDVNVTFFFAIRAYDQDRDS